MRARLLAAVTALALALPAVALAATKNGITPLSPKNGATVPLAKSVTFKMRVRGKGRVFVHVCKSPKRSRKEGVICNRLDIAEGRRKGRIVTATGRFFDFPEHWLNTPGTYYWQAHRIHCNRNLKDCKREGPVTKIKVG